ncbi:FAD binding domain-containing protein [Xylariaceae sp. FL0255]|nr:FAD binding domain-containing protein [Xylariaceae sp. FL0255]
MAVVHRGSFAWARSILLLLFAFSSWASVNGLATGASTAPSPSIIVCQLKRVLSAESGVYVANGLNLTDVDILPRWNAFDAPIYTVYTKPATIEDVQKIVLYASEYNIPFLATGGGHGYTNTTSALKGGIDIDLGAFKSIQINSSKNTMTVGGSVTFSDILDPLYAAGKELPIGSCSCVGMNGAALGGGVGPYQGVHGLLLDNLLEVTIVTGQGEILTASTTQNADLFWGVRGAGFNFGIVVSAQYKIYDALNGGNAYNGDFLYSADKAEAVFNLAAKFLVNQPDELSMFPSITFDQTTEQTAVMMSVVYIGSVANGTQYMQAFADLNPFKQSVSVLPYNELIKENRFGADSQACTKGFDNAVYGSNVLEFDVATYVELVNDFNNFYTANPLIVALLVTELFPHRVTELTPDAATAYPYRTNLGDNFVSFIFLNPLTAQQDSQVANTFALQTRQKLIGKNPLSVYVNYAHGDEGPVAWYSSRKLPALHAIKSKYDPKNLFHFTNSFT